jgi:amidase
MAAFWAYERALMDDDVEAMDRLFAPGDSTLRGDADGLLVGHAAIAAFRRSRGGAPPRTIVDVHVQEIDEDHALVVAVTAPANGGRGQQTQLWRRGAAGWQVTAAHVSGPAPAFDTRTWRALGDPLVPPTSRGPLDGRGVAVKDVYAVAGHPTGAGNPAWLAAAPPQPDHADAVSRLLAAGAAVTGITRTDELAYSLAGQNAHHGTPPNPAAPGRISGGSTSGSATAVAQGHARLGLGTDTGGSIRVPAAYQGLHGLRTTHGLVDRAGVLPLAPSFDTVGWLARTAADLEAAGRVLVPGSGHTLDQVVVVPGLLELARPDVAAAVRRQAARLDAREQPFDTTALPEWRAAFSTWQAHEAWQSHGAWLETRMHTLGPDVRGRFETARAVTTEQRADAERRGREAGRRFEELVADRVVVLPAASSVAPRPGDDVQATREATLQLTCLAGLAGLPCLVVPTTTEDGLPAGVGLVGPRGSDRALLALVAEQSQSLQS